MKEYKEIKLTLDEVIRIADNHLLLDRCTGKRLYCPHVYHGDGKVTITLDGSALSEEEQKEAEWYMEYEEISKDGTPLLRLNAKIDGKPVFAGAVFFSPDKEFVDILINRTYD